MNKNYFRRIALDELKDTAFFLEQLQSTMPSASETKLKSQKGKEFVRVSLKNSNHIDIYNQNYIVLKVGADSVRFNSVDAVKKQLQMSFR